MKENYLYRIIESPAIRPGYVALVNKLTRQTTIVTREIAEFVFNAEGV